ncbi:MAG: dioxygenase [Pirellulales bacterium]|nr:dioxygenase [Pirellulales bacterium]
MTKTLLRKQSSEGVGYAVVELNGTRHIVASAVPQAGADLREQAHDALRTIEAVMEDEGTRGSIVRQAVFMKDIGQIETCRQIIHDFYGEQLPATIYIPQPPCEGKLLEIEALGVGGRGDVEIQRYSERMVVSRHDGVAWVHLANVYPETTATGVYERSRNVFELAAQGLAARGFSYDQVMRTWLYLGDIVGPEGETQRYKELNRARTDFYEGIRFGAHLTPPGWERTIYPASTGIGTDGNDVVMSCMALVSYRKDVLMVPLENPQQTSACDYGRKYGFKSPKFARAMAVAAHDLATIFVSGTASITDEETQFVGDVQGQTRQTLDNIAALISADNLRQHGLSGLGATLDDLALVRVYIKHQEDYAKTRAVCEARLGEVPTIYAQADVCRPELLVEIEGIAFAHPGVR